jgi:hypothetical protein
MQLQKTPVYGGYIQVGYIMNKLIAILFFFTLLGCSPKISEHFEQNKFIKNYNIHIINDSLLLYFKSPADITYVTNRNDLKKIIRKKNFKLKDSVLIYGKTDEPPYEYFVTISQPNINDYPKELIILDTIIEDKMIRFIGNSLSPNSYKSLVVDLRNIFNSLELGTTYRKQINTIFDIVNKYHSSNKFFEALNEVTVFPTYDKQEEWSQFQMQLTFSSFLGKNIFYETYLNKLESKFNQNENISKIIGKNVVIGSNIFDTITREAKKHKIVMINENHFYPNHRVLVYDLLSKLREAGFEYLALEALNPGQDSVLNLPNSFPTIETGFYTREQNYSNLIRKAKELGYKFIAYENTDDNKNREIGQAENLYNKTFKLNPNSKVLVLAGIDHILENPTSEGKEWMATIFKNKYHIDPLTISQTHLNSYRKQIDSNYGLISSKFFDDEITFSVDYLVLNNINNSLIINQGKYVYRNNTEYDVQISLFYGNEIANQYDYFKKVPYFTTILKSSKKIVLPIDDEQDIYIYTFDINGNKLDEQIITSANSVYEK